ncbi:MAG: PAS domain-containing protein [Alphaproteobacteria bacterium]|jgi:PAS domain S-box-containing protein
MREHAELGIPDSANLLRRIMDAVPVGISYFDLDQRFCFANREYETFTGMSADGLIGRTLEEVIGAPAYQVARPHVERALKGESAGFENTPAPIGGKPITIAVSYMPDVGSDGAVQGFFALVEDTTRRHSAEVAPHGARDELEQRVEDRTTALRHSEQSLANAQRLAHV